ncbi:MAG TPA: SGNH/GDSL hydrolase family protein [Candidatus Acidoferrales bacterium]|jgi:lysophospholipase L1-like esterase|nr:SGNH/GDSL hydrolase family protein [Candidatus Acidoferrales bacterium]
MRIFFALAVTVATLLAAPAVAAAAVQEAAATTPGLFARNAPLTIAVVGDSTLRTIVAEGSATPCGDPAFPAPCVFQDSSPLAYTHVLGEKNTLYDFASLGSQTQGAHPIADVLSVQVAKLPPNANLVIVDVDASAAYARDSAGTTAGFNALLDAIRSRAPHARIMILGARVTRGADPAQVSIWNFHAKTVATSSGATYVGMSERFPMRDYSDFPDTQHPNADGSKAIATLIETVAYGGRMDPTPRSSGAPAIPAAIALPKSDLPPLPPRSQRIKIAVIGASGEINAILPGSPVPCGNLLSAPPCVYETLPFPSAVAYPTLVGALANAQIYNFAVGGSQTADAKTYGKIPDALSDQVPKIPADTDVVLLDIGIIDMSVNGATEEILNRADKIAAAVHTQAPRAHMIFLNIHDYATEIKSRVLKWNEREAKVAAQYGAPVIDMHTLFPASDYVDFPDEGHPSAIGAMKVAILIDELIDKMRASH